MDPRLTAALFSVFKPLANLLLNNEVGARIVIEYMKLAFVQTAYAEFGQGGKPASISAISKMTGLSRKEIRRLLEKEVDCASNSELYGATEANILGRWVAHQDYLDENGRPRTLEFGPGPGTFSNLVSESVGDLSPLRYLSRLSEQQCVVVHDDGKISLDRRDWLIDSDLAMLIGDGIGTIAQTISRNHIGKRESRLCQRIAYSANIEPAKVDIMRRIGRERIESFVEEIDDYFIGFEAENPTAFYDKDGKELVRIGVGAYYFEVEK